MLFIENFSNDYIKIWFIASAEGCHILKMISKAARMAVMTKVT